MKPLQEKEIMWHIHFGMNLNLVMILFNDNSQPHVARKRSQKLS